MNTMSEPTFLEACREVPRGDRPQLRVEVGLLGPKAEPAVLLRGSVWGRSKRWHHVVHQGKRKAGESLKDARARMERLAERFRLYLDRWRLGQEAKEAELERTIEGVR